MDDGKETNRQRRLFEYWHALGPKRTFNAVEDEFKVSAATVRKYAERFGWEERSLALSSAKFEELVKDTESEVSRMRDEVISILRFMYRKVAEFNPDGTVKSVRLGKVRNLADLEKLVKLFLLMSGAPTENEKLDVHLHGLNDIPEDALRAIAGNLPTESGVRTGQA